MQEYKYPPCDVGKKNKIGGGGNGKVGFVLGHEDKLAIKIFCVSKNIDSEKSNRRYDFTVRDENEEEAIISVKCSETALCFWALQYADFVEVLEPENVRERIKESVKGLVGKYEV